MKKISQIFDYLKYLIFEFFFVLQYNSIHNKHVTVLVQILELVSLVYLYFNPIYSHLDNFKYLHQYIYNIYPKLVFIYPQQQAIVSAIILLIVPSIFIGLILMKYSIGYQYLMILAIEICIIVYPIVFVKIVIQCLNIFHFDGLLGIGLILLIFNLIGSFFILQYFDKKHKFCEILSILLIFYNVHPYACLSITLLKIFLGYYLSRVTLIRDLRLFWELALIIVVFSCYFVSDILTNMISFGVLIGAFTIPQIFRIYKDYNKYQNIFYRLENMLNQQIQKLNFYDFIEDHRLECQNIRCLCREIAQIKDDGEIQKKAYEFVQELYKFKEDFYSRIQLGKVCYQKYDYQLSGLSYMFQLKPLSIYQQYRLYYNKTTYQEQFRKNDKNYSFGDRYYNVYEEYRDYQQKIANLTLIIKNFWKQILNFDGSKKFLQLIRYISEQINQINEKYVIYNDKYQQYPQFKYLYRTFQIAILNIINSNSNNNNNNSKQKGQSSSMSQISEPIEIKIPDRELFFVSVQGKITNCNLDFCNFLHINKSQIINRPYYRFLPDIYIDIHKDWVDSFYSGYNKQQRKETYKTFKIKNQFIKVIKMSNIIIPRFQTGVEIITFIKIVNQLQIVLKDSQPEINKLNQNFFSFLIDKQTLKIIYMDQNFFYVNDLPITQDLRKKVLSLKITDIYPKFILKSESQYYSARNQHQKSSKQVMLNYNAINQFIDKKNKNNLSVNSMLSRGSSYNSIQNSNLSRRPSFSPFQNSNLNMLSPNNQLMTLPQDLNKVSNRRKNKKSVFFGPGGIQRQKPQSIFCYQVIQQYNKSMTIQYCIVNFKIKSRVNYDMQFINQFKQRKSVLMVNNMNNFNNAIHNNNSKLNGNDNPELNLKDKIKQDNLNRQQKNFCLPWPIIMPLIIVHFIYIYIQQICSQSRLYMSKCFTFYQKYEKTIIRLLDIKLEMTDYVQDMKKLWIQGYGFYHDSLLFFQKAEDEQFKRLLYEQVIKINHYGITIQIDQALQQKYQLLSLLKMVVLIILIMFIVYVVVDFGLNIAYAFRTYKKVVEIIFIFLNIQKKDVNLMVQAIDLYQCQILEMYYYDTNDKIKQQKYEFDNNYDAHLLNSGQNSIIEFKDSSRYSQSFRQSGFLQIQKRFSSTKFQNPNKTGLKSKIDIQLFKKKMQQFKNSSIKQVNNNNHSQNNSKFNPNFNQNLYNRNYNTNNNIFGNNQNIKSPQNIVFQYDNLSKHLTDQFLAQQQKRKDISKFKQRYTQKWNQIKQNINVYTLICLGFLLSGLVLGIGLVFISEFINNQYSYGKVYRNLQMMDIVLFKQLIQKATGYQLQPYVRISSFNQQFYLDSGLLLSQLSQFQLFWNSIYKDNVCSLLSQVQLTSLCKKLDNSIVDFGQKVISQYLQQYLRLNNRSDILNNSLLYTQNFINMVKINLNLIHSAEIKLYNNIQKYSNQTKLYQLLICSLGTIILFLCILLLRKALNQIKGKINEGENLLLIVPENIKIKYMIENKNQKKLDKFNQNLNQKLKMKKEPQISQIQCSASSLVVNSQAKASPIEKFFNRKF